MKLALEVWSSDPTQVTTTCRRAEDLGFDGFYYGESPNGLNLDCWSVLAALSSVTSRIRLGPVISNVLPDYRSNLLLAKQAATVAALSNGRLDFRTGVGATTSHGRAWWQPHGIDYPDYESRLDLLIRCLADLRRLWSTTNPLPPAAVHAIGGESTNGAGPGLGLIHPPIPLTVAATGDRAMALASVAAEVWEASFRTPEEYRSLRRRFERLRADKIERTLILRSLEIDGFVGTSNEKTRRVLDVAHRARGSNEDMDRVLGRALVGRPWQVAERMAALATAGVDQLVVALHDPHDADALEALALARDLL